MAKFKYKNISDQDLVIMNVGEVKAGGIIETTEMLENVNLELVEQEVKKSEDKKEDKK